MVPVPLLSEPRNALEISLCVVPVRPPPSPFLSRRFTVLRDDHCLHSPYANSLTRAHAHALAEQFIYLYTQASILIFLTDLNKFPPRNAALILNWICGKVSRIPQAFAPIDCSSNLLGRTLSVPPLSRCLHRRPRTPTPPVSYAAVYSVIRVVFRRPYRTFTPTSNFLRPDSRLNSRRVTPAPPSAPPYANSSTTNLPRPPTVPWFASKSHVRRPHRRPH